MSSNNLIDYIDNAIDPIGSLNTIAGTSSIDNKWLYCDGSSVLKTEYPDLYEFTGNNIASSLYIGLPNIPNTVIKAKK